ncbi:hypothetical protein CVIRNUC_003560 [Coccomyxa viridis]|uniref:Uncharacterized protein n=1 Tax=Coccomyxa viridis TaxID=1274662 RepID=A0AAV1I1N2_9CHLO|nr:hypothetical protein CVIRNUC_003560 [Coccomyxa viridis]
MDTTVDYSALLEGLSDEADQPFATPQEIEELMSDNCWSENTGLAGPSDRSVTDNTGTSGGMLEAGLQTSPEAAPIVQAPGSVVPPIAQAPQAPTTESRPLSNTKMLFLRTIYELSKADPERNPEGIVSLDDIRNARTELATINKTGKQGALHALVRTHRLVVYMKDFDPALKSKYKLTPEGLSLCQRKFN